MNILFAINRNFTGLLCTCMRSVMKHGGEDHYDAYILHSDLDDEDIHRIRMTAQDRIACHFIRVEEEIFAGFPESARYPKQIYYRLAAPLLLPEDIDRILYLDVDLVVINPLEQLYHMEFGDNYYIACSHVNTFLKKFNQARLGVEDVPYINTGVLLMNLDVLRHTLSIERIRQTAEEKMRSFLLPDQDMLTVMYGDKIKLADTMRYNLSDRMLNIYNVDPRHEKLDLDWVKENAVIIHYYGKNRPWKENYNGILDVFYWETVNESDMEVQKV